jgi:hypothetical protein
VAIQCVSRLRFLLSFALTAVGPGLARVKKTLEDKGFVVLVVVLMIILAVETSVLVIIALRLEDLTRNLQNIPPVSLFPYLVPQCSTLTAQVESQTSGNRTVHFLCTGRANYISALRVEPPPFSLTFSKGADAPFAFMVPTFKLPPGYLSLSLAPSGCGAGTQPLTSGERIVIGYFWYYDYCAVISNSAGRVGGFIVWWREVPGPGLCCTVSVSPSQLTVPAGQTAYAAMTVTALGNFSGDVSLESQTEWQSGARNLSGLTASFNPPSIVLKTGGSNSTTIVLTAQTGLPVGSTWRVSLGAYGGPHAPRAYAFISVKVT